jgi:adenosylcobinamide-phosphate synthase
VWFTGLPAVHGADAALLACAPALALAIDRLLGEPPARGHPVVWMGRWLAWAGVRLAPRANLPQVLSDARVFWAAALSWCAAAAAVFAATWLLQAWVLTQPVWLAALALGLFLKPLLAWARLHDETLAVEGALGRSPAADQAPPAGPGGLAARSPHQAREAAIGCLAAQLGDALVAPLFWFALLGLPGAALLRFASTAHALWGDGIHAGGQGWRWAGQWAAGAHAALAWLPARLTAVLIVLLGGAARCLAQLPAQARRNPGPDGGWPVAAMALARGVHLRQPGAGTLNAGGRPPAPADTVRACAIGSRTALVATLLACGCGFL